MCYYGSEFPRFIKKDQGHFHLMADLHTLIRNGQQNLYTDDAGKDKLIKDLLRIIENVRNGDYATSKSNTQDKTCINTLKRETAIQD